MVIKSIIENKDFSRNSLILLFLIEILIISTSIVSLLNIRSIFTDSLSSYFLISGIFILIIYLFGKSILNYRLSLVRREIVESYKESPIKKLENVEDELNFAVNEYKIKYFKSHIKIGLSGTISLYLIIMDGFLMNLFDLSDFHLLGYTIFRDIGILGMFLVLLYFYRSYTEDPQTTLRENLNNFRRVSATGRKGL